MKKAQITLTSEQIKFILILIGILAIVSYLIYQAIKPEKIEAKELHGMIQEASNFINEDKEMLTNKNLGKVTSNYYEIHTGQIDDELKKIKDDIEVKDFEIDIKINKEELLSVLDQATKESTNIHKEKFSSVPEESSKLEGISSALDNFKNQI
jgi:hypothetical protein